jgi:hypothetical protein
METFLIYWGASWSAIILAYLAYCVLHYWGRRALHGAIKAHVNAIERDLEAINTRLAAEQRARLAAIERTRG